MYWKDLRETEYYDCFGSDWDSRYSGSEDVVRAPEFYQNQITGHIQPVTPNSIRYTGNEYQKKKALKLLNMKQTLFQVLLLKVQSSKIATRTTKNRQ